MSGLTGGEICAYCELEGRSTCRVSMIFSSRVLPPSRAISSLICTSRSSITPMVYVNDFVWSRRYPIACVFNVGVVGRFWSTSGLHFRSATSRRMLSI